MPNERLPFRKMSGFGNDFVVLDARVSKLTLSPATTRLLADREAGVGCDQVIVMEPSQSGDVFMRVMNADGTEVAACGNATRCLAGLLSDETGRTDIVIETAAGLLPSRANADGTITVDMGEPRFGWQDIPLARAEDTDVLNFTAATARGVLEGPSAVNVGNPHCIFWVEDDVDAYDLAVFGPRVETDPLFPERANVSLAQILSHDAVKLRVWERGAGLTQACGTAACAVTAAAARRGLAGRKLAVALPGGMLDIEWREENGHIFMTGPWTLDFEGVFAMAEASPAQ